MGRIRGKRNRDNDRYTTERRDADQEGMVGAAPVEVTQDGEFVYQLVDIDPLAVSEAPRDTSLVAMVRDIVAKRTDYQPPRANKKPERVLGFMESVDFTHPPERRHDGYVGVSMQTGSLLRLPDGTYVEVVSVRNAHTLKSGAAFWMWNPERAFRFIYGELFHCSEKERIFGRVPNGRWKDRTMPTYARIYMETAMPKPSRSIDELKAVLLRTDIGHRRRQRAMKQLARLVVQQRIQESRHAQHVDEGTGSIRAIAPSLSTS